MSRRIADLLIKIGADSYEFQQKAKQVEKGLDALTKRLDKVGKEVSLKVTAPLVALGAVSLSLADTQAKAEAKVQQAIKSTGGAAKLNFDQLKHFASELQGKTIFGDEKILNDSTAQLLTFTNIAGENFKRTQAVALDLATVLDGDLKSASIQLGKALNDPVKNLTALSRAGIQFSKEQTATIKHLAETNRLAEAQGLILEELERQYGGQAEAAAKVGLGALQQLKNSWGDFLEQIGATLMPVVTKIAGALSQVVAVLQNMNPQMRETIVVVAGIAAAIGPLAMGIGGIIRMLPMLSAGFTALLSPVGLAVAAVLALGAAFFYAHQRKKDLLDEMTTKFEGLSLGTLEKRLKENKRLQEVNERESPWQGNSPYSKLTYALNKGKRRDNLKMEEEALTEAIRRNTQAYEERQRVEAESKKIADDMANALKGVNTETVRGGGLINDLTTKIEALEKKKLLPNATVEDIAAANAEIATLKEELNNLQNITPEQLNRKPLEPILPTAVKPIMPALEVKLPDLKPIITKAQQQMMEIRKTVTEGIYGWAEVTSSGLQSSIMETEAIVGKYTEALVAKGWKFSEALTFVSDKVSEVMKGFDESLSNFIAESIEAAAEAIGQIIAGDLGFDGLMKAILLQLASFLKQIGTQLIEFGVMIIAFKMALKSVLANPWAAIAIGAAMVAAAAVMTALINKNAQKNAPKLAKGGLAYGPTYAMVGDNPNARIDPEVIAPLSKLQGMMSGGRGSQNIQIALSGQLTAKGRDLVYVLGKENFKIDVLGG